MDFCISPASRKPYILVGFGIFRPFLAPAACWCALHEVLSMDRSCMSASVVSCSNSFLKMSFLLHRRNLEYTVCQAPNRSGKSRHAEPVFEIHSIPLSILRFGFDGLPSPVFSGGKISLIRSHSWSLISWRNGILLPRLLFPQLYRTSTFCAILSFQTRPNFSLQSTL